ncbi:MAG: lytic transglycosylase [Candidatus Desulfovibrio kirbyi]|uniref:Lytic transglycosylase n=1 Tax=Candidatus Desulfovibrio kirbyi TaxID=2696086 RepID=A0A6L2R7E6_9BACT|nr:MAG: lytic transglycosylase [Candidatus Desulfovibrio kirbyi]
MNRPNSYSHAFLYFLCALYLVLAGGCGTHQGGLQNGDHGFVVPEDDSSAPLTRTELAALQSTGQIDRNVPATAMADVARQYKHFLRKGRNTMSMFSKRSEQYLAYARKVFRSRGIPDELAYLAIVESGYRANAKSPAGAVGAWQFMPYTATQYGLRQDWWTDERLDPYKSTEAAADYLRKLHGDFGDWATAAAAYNAGEGKINRAKQGTGARHFYEIAERNHRLDEKAQLRDETKQYVPRLLAVTKIMRNLPQLGFDPISPETAPGVLRFSARPGTDLKGLARQCGIDWDEFAALNPHHKRPITSTERSSHVYVPVCNERQATNFLRSPASAPYADWRPSSVRSKVDSWEKISRRSGASVAQLRAVNPDHSALRAGDTVLVPRSVDMSHAAVAALDKRETPRRAGKAVARKYNVSIRDLQEYNQIADANKVRAGHVLRIPAR